MGYKTLYRVFRPKTFDEVYGQAHITDILKKQIEKGRISHAYLFYGPRGTGKTSTAKILANAINCTSPVNGNPCLQCEVCQSVAKDAFVDIVEIDAASNNSVDNVRDIREKVALLPALGKYKVYIIDEVHMLSAGAFNALLKTLEEPPSHAVFILATTELRKLPATILSRCQRYDFKRITDEDIMSRLKEVAQKSNIEYEEEAIPAIAQAAEGALRDALSIMDQCIAGKDKLTLKDVYESMGVADRVKIAELAQFILEENPKEALRMAGEIGYDGVEPHNVLRDLVEELSSLLAKNIADTYQRANILRALEVLIGIQGTLRFSYTPEAILLAAIVRASVNTTDTDTKDFELRIKKLENRVEQLVQKVVELQKTKPPEAKPAPATQAVQQSVPLPKEAKAVEESAPKKEKKQTEVQTKQEMDGGVKEKLKLAIQQRQPGLVPALGTIKNAFVLPRAVEFYVEKEDLPIAEMMTHEAYQKDMEDATSEVLGDAKKIVVRADAEQTKKEETTEDVKQMLFDAFGVDNVVIKE